MPLPKRILVDENAMRLFTDEKWKRLKYELELRGLVFVPLPRDIRGISDAKLAEIVINKNFAGIITEDNDFVESNTNPLFFKLMNNGRLIYRVQRVPSTSQRYEFRVFVYKNGIKQCFLRLKPDGTVLSGPNC